ncbi:T9SS type B sorting domain-containing protein [Flavobacterium xueshanense]|uniref:Gliding motility-associated C-terminal domain-containing protein n=1 Tax=Flavobacterium xueshanense TaxID=935223 RepID=A0A1I2FPA9_9FLAO|nr:T9SS type B sorting domain-containing protein [Flavobacterium xueshanense]SFF06608.1 gliding motility-associated C-terminal domain-containing protein [Flavobacterium xueshanense]
MKKTLLIFFTFLSISCFAQLSNKHWIPPLHSRNSSNAQITDQYVYLSTAETTPFLVTVTDGRGIPFAGSPFSLSASNSVEIKIGDRQPSKMFLELIDVNKVVSDKGIILEGIKDFYVSFRMMAQNHSETLISKGKPGIGTSFRLGCTINESLDNRKNFVASVMATEDNTDITLSDYDTGVVFASGSGNITSASQTFSNLKAGESIVFSGYSNTPANLTGIIGALITSNNPVAVNTGNVLGGIENGRADITLDQIVSASQIGNEYIFIEGNGLPNMETPLIVADNDGTVIYINDIPTPIITIDAGEYYQVPNSYYQGSINRNLYVKTSKPVFAYQLIGGGANTATSGLNFIPPLSCFFQNSVNIPQVNKIGSTTYTSDLMILTYTTSTLTVNGNIIPQTQAQPILGNTDWVTYRISNITGDANVISTGPLAVGVFGFQGTASGFAGYYSGFGSTPQDTNVTVCSNATQDLFDVINGNPDTGGSWTVPPSGNPLNGNLFDPTINSPGEYNYSFTKDCNSAITTISLKVNVTIQQSKNAGSNNSITICTDSSSFDLFSLLGTADVGGTWSPALTSGTGIFDPAVDLSGLYTYSFPAVGSCATASATINVTNNAIPLNYTITDFEICDNNSDGNDSNGFVDFDLTNKNSEILGSQTGINVTYHKLPGDAESGINPITTLYSSNTTIYARLTNILSSCYIVNSFKLVVNPLPLVNDVTIIQCDDDLDAISTFNLTVKNDVISSNFTNENFTYYTTQTEANNPLSIDQISTPLAFENINPPLPAPQGIMNVWARVVNKITGCFSIAKLTLKVAASKIPPTYSYIQPPVCDDILATDGTSTGDPNTNKRDGISVFDLTNAINDVESQLPPPLSNYTFKYYRNKADALAQNDASGNSLAIKPSEYTNFRNDIPFAQNIWVRVNNNLTSDCGAGFGDFIKLSVEKLPFANPVIIPSQCDDDQDGIFVFNTATLKSTLLGTNQSFPVTVTYFDATNNPLKDVNGVLISSPFPNSFSTKSQIIKAVVTNNTTQKCFDETMIQFIVDDLPEAFAVPIALTTTCDDETNPLVQDGKFGFDTAIFQTTILNGQIGMNVKYFDQNGKALPSPLPNPFITGTQNVKVIVENPINTSCFAELTIPFVIDPLPNISLNTDGSEDKLVCQNDPSFFVQLDAGIQDGSPTGNYTYIWSKDGIVLPSQTGYILDVNAEGLYTVEAFNGKGCSRIRVLKVTASDVAHIDTIQIVDMADINTVTVNVTGAGDYEYSLDEDYGPYQDSNFFDNVPAGIHDVYINDKNGCGTVSKTIAVTGVPKFFTPNGDGINDYWNVKGVNNVFNKNAVIYIYDRYGKLLKQITASSQGWDGTFTGQPLPSDDYWYSIKLDDGREAKGHFSLKR